MRPPLTTALQVRSLSVADAQQGLAVRLRGTVTFFDAPDAVFIQDETAGTFFRPNSGQPFVPGEIVEIVGTTQPGLYLPGIYLATTGHDSARALGRGPLPKPIPARYNDLISGRYHYQRVMVEGVVRSLAPLEESRRPADPVGERSVMRVSLEGRIVEVRVESGLQNNPPPVDSRVRVVGLAAGAINSRRQLVQPYLRILDWSEAEILEPAVPEPAVPRISAADIQTFRVSGPGDRRVRLAGIVTACVSNGLAYVRGERGAFGVRFFTPTEVKVGERVEVLGFSEMDRFSARVVDAKLVARAPGEPPAPVELKIDESIAGSHDGDLVAVTAEVTDIFRTESGPALTLQRGGRALQVRGPLPESVPPVGSLVRVVGICQVESSVGTRYNASPDTVIIRLRSTADLTVLESPSAWTVQRLATILALLLATMLLAALWITLLKRQVARQTEALRIKIGSEAALEERQRIAREFHDSLEQELAGLNLRLDALATRSLDEKGRSLLGSSRNLVARIQSETRNLISDLRNPAEIAGDLAAALRDLVDRNVEHPGMDVSLQVDEKPPRLPARTVHHLRMIAAEAITNALKHAEASRITLSVRGSAGRLRLTVSDNGRGFDSASTTGGRAGHFGCVGIRERCRTLGADATWTSRPGAGTTVEISLPLPSPLPS